MDTGSKARTHENSGADTSGYLSCLSYGVPMIFHKCLTNVTRLLNIMGLFCKRALSKRLYSTKETYDFKEPSNGYSGADTSLKDIHVGRLDISRVSYMRYL